MRRGLKMAEEMPLAGALVGAGYERPFGWPSRISLQFQENAQIVQVFRTARCTLHVELLQLEERGWREDLGGANGPER